MNLKNKLKEGNFIGKTLKTIWWVLFGNLSSEQKAKLISILAFLANEGKDALQHIEINVGKDGFTIRYKKEF